MIRPRNKWPLLFAVLCLLSLILVSSGRLDATEEAAVQVAQPILTEDAVVVSSVTYILWLGSPIPGIEVAWTTKPNLIQREGDPKPTRDSSLYLPADDVVNATVESILLNAAHGRPPVVKYVALKVEGGPPEYRRLGKVYPVDRTPGRAPRE